MSALRWHTLDVLWKDFCRLYLSMKCLPPPCVELQSLHGHWGRRLRRSSAPFLNPNCEWSIEAGLPSPAQPSHETLGSFTEKSFKTIFSPKVIFLALLMTLYTYICIYMLYYYHHYLPPSSSISEHLQELFPTKTPAGEISFCSRWGWSPPVLGVKAKTKTYECKTEK